MIAGMECNRFFLREIGDSSTLRRATSTRVPLTYFSLFEDETKGRRGIGCVDAEQVRNSISSMYCSSSCSLISSRRSDGRRKRSLFRRRVLCQQREKSVRRRHGKEGNSGQRDEKQSQSLERLMLWRRMSHEPQQKEEERRQQGNNSRSPQGANSRGTIPHCVYVCMSMCMCGSQRKCEECKQEQLNHMYSDLAESNHKDAMDWPWFKFSLTRCKLRLVSSSSSSTAAANTTSDRMTYESPMLAVHISRILLWLKCRSDTTNLRVMLDTSSPWWSVCVENIVSYSSVTCEQEPVRVSDRSQCQWVNQKASTAEYLSKQKKSPDAWTHFWRIDEIIIDVPFQNLYWLWFTWSAVDGDYISCFDRWSISIDFGTISGKNCN